MDENKYDNENQNTESESNSTSQNTNENINTESTPNDEPQNTSEDDTQKHEWHSSTNNDGEYTHSFNWSYEQMHEPIRFDNEVKGIKRRVQRNLQLL